MSDRDPSLDRAVTAIGDLSTSVRSLHAEVVQSETLRTRKIKLITAALIALVPATVLLIVLAATNIVLMSRINQAASDSRSTNQLLYGCMRPGTTCSNENLKRTGEVMDELRQTQFVIAVCQRQYPITEDPQGAALVSCVQRYYPTFTLPPRVK
jgi:hypothetical protein